MRLGPGRVAVAALLFFLFLGFLGLGGWQVERLQWKLDLIARVDARVHAEPVPAPAVADWPRVDAARDEYRRVSVSGILLHQASAYVQAVTEMGAGFWVLTPMRRDDGSVVFINRGFVAARPSQGVVASASASTFASASTSTSNATTASEPTTVTGLLRLPEPGGGFLRRNDPTADRWFSRDVAAIGTSRRLDRVAPFFVDADRAPATSTVADSGNAEPVGGLTVVRFHNSHLIYAFTWFALALGTLAAAWQVRRAWIAKDRTASAAH